MMQLRLSILPYRLAICHLGADAAMPSWVRGTFTSATRSPTELSLICDDAAVPAEINAERGWRALQVLGTIPFEVTGVAAALVAPLAAAEISVFVIGTFDTDYLLVKDDTLARAIDALRGAGHEVDGT